MPIEQLLALGGQATGATPPPGTRALVTGSFTTGSAVEMGTVQATAQGGVFTANAPGQPLDGLELTVPRDAYTQALQFKLSYRPVSATTFKGFTPISPLISIDNGGATAGDLMTLKVPVTVPAGQTVAGFIYDEKTGRLEGLPLVAVDSTSVTVATWHFSNAIIMTTDSQGIKSSIIDSGFRPRPDGWQFPNCGSFISPGGALRGPEPGGHMVLPEQAGRGSADALGTI